MKTDWYDKLGPKDRCFFFLKETGKVIGMVTETDSGLHEANYFNKVTGLGVYVTQYQAKMAVEREHEEWDKK